MIPTKQATAKQRRSSMTRNDNRPWGYQEQIGNSRSFSRLKKGVAEGLFPKSVLATKYVKLSVRGKKK